MSLSDGCPVCGINDLNHRHTLREFRAAFVLKDVLKLFRQMVDAQHTGAQIPKHFMDRIVTTMGDIKKAIPSE